MTLQKMLVQFFNELLNVSKIMHCIIIMKTTETGKPRGRFVRFGISVQQNTLGMPGT